LSIYLENDVLSDPPPLAPRIEYQKHKDTIPEFVAMLPGVKPEDFPDGEAAAAEWVRLTTHSGTHLDAPWHFHSTMNKGERAITIDEVPLEWCFQPGVKLDFRDRPDGYVCTAMGCGERAQTPRSSIAAARYRRREHAQARAMVRRTM
jgi:kynurenine formamidase